MRMLVRMNLDTLLCAARILRAQPACTLPLVRLHALLREQLGPAAGSYAQLYHQLKSRPQSFMLFDSPRLLDAAHSWPAEVREHYHHAFQRAGLGACVRVALTELPPDPSDGALALAGHTVSELWRCAGSDAVLRDLLVRASRQLEEISARLQADAATEHPTTPAPGLPPES